MFILYFVPSELNTIGDLDGVDKDYINFKSNNSIVVKIAK